MNTDATTDHDEPCIACFGMRTQTRNDGVRVICPSCGGTGNMPKLAPAVMPPAVLPEVVWPYTPTVTPEPFWTRPSVPGTPWPYSTLTCTSADTATWWFNGKAQTQ